MSSGKTESSLASVYVTYQEERCGLRHLTDVFGNRTSLCHLVGVTLARDLQMRSAQRMKEELREELCIYDVIFVL